MAKEFDIELYKEVISHNQAKVRYNTSFSELTKSSTALDADALLSTYSSIFYDIPVNGKYSHKKIIDQSYEYVRSEYLKGIDNEINTLTTHINNKENELRSLENPELNNPIDQIYEDGSYLIAGENGQKYPDMHTIYIMQEGRKRAIQSDNMFKFVIRRSAGQPEDYSGKYYVTFEELNKIPDGPPIATFSDLNLKGNDLKTDLPDILGVSAFVDVDFRCDGNEMSDYVGEILANTNYQTEMQFYLDNQACIIKYIKDDYVNDDEGPVVLTATIPKGTTQTIRLLRESINLTNNIPSNMDQYYEEGLDILYNGNTVNNYIRRWGPGQLYNSVVFASGRISSKQQPQDAEPGFIQDNLEFEIFNGLPTEDTGMWTANPNITIISSTGYTGQEISDYNTRMIYRQPGLWGNLGQEEKLQEKVFNNPGNPYYQPTATLYYSTYSIYGQPILRYDNKYLVIANAVGDGLSGRFVLFYIVGDGGDNNGTFMSLKRGKFEDRFGMTMSYSGGTIHHLNWPELDTDTRLKYPGLQEWQLNKYASGNVGNYFNPNEGGSNYELTNANTW